MQWAMWQEHMVNGKIYRHANNNKCLLSYNIPENKFEQMLNKEQTWKLWMDVWNTQWFLSGVQRLNMMVAICKLIQTPWVRQLLYIFMAVLYQWVLNSLRIPMDMAGTETEVRDVCEYNFESDGRDSVLWAYAYDFDLWSSSLKYFCKKPEEYFF